MDKGSFGRGGATHMCGIGRIAPRVASSKAPVHAFVASKTFWAVMLPLSVVTVH